MTTGVETGFIKSVVETLLKPFAIITTPIAERIASWLKRKPKLHVNFHPIACVWCIAKNREEPLMQVRFAADLTHDDPKESLIIVDAHPDGTKLVLPFDKISVPPHNLREVLVAVFVQPVLQVKGKDWTGRIIFIDQFGRKYKTQKHTFRGIS